MEGWVTLKSVFLQGALLKLKVVKGVGWERGDV